MQERKVYYNKNIHQVLSIYIYMRVQVRKTIRMSLLSTIYSVSSCVSICQGELLDSIFVDCVFQSKT